VAEVDPGIVEALGKLAAEDPIAAQNAGLALQWLTGNRGAGRLTQERVQRFLWYELPLKWGADFTARRAVAASLERALDLLDLPRYAELCRSAATAKVFSAYDNGADSGLRAYREANIASGIYPQDLPEFGWGATMGIEEANALAQVQDYLELAIAGGDLVPGSRGWKAYQAKLVRNFINTPSFQLGGQPPISIVYTERIQTWLSIEQSPTRRQLLSDLANRLLHPVELPPGTEDPYPSLTWLLGHLVQGILLTEKGNLNQAFVQAAASRFFWPFERPPRTEPDIMELHDLRLLAQRLKLARKQGRTMVITKKGRAVLGDPPAWWRMVPVEIFPHNVFGMVCGELFLAQLIDCETLPLKQVMLTVGSCVAEAGYREAGTGEPPGQSSVERTVYETIHTCRSLGLLSAGISYLDDDIGLTPIGKSVALQALRARATAPGAIPVR
jgi:hypothetical protein